MENKEVKISINGITLYGFLAIPESAKSIVIFVHGAGSSRYSPRNNFVANELFRNGMATLLFDLLTKEEDMIYENRFDIGLLAERLVMVTKWIMKKQNTKKLNIGYFGASTGSAAALIAAARMQNRIKAIVSRGGRPDMAIGIIDKVKAATLLIVGGNDSIVIGLNNEAYKKISSKKNLIVIAGATHLFEEPGKLKKVAKYAINWFQKYLI